MKCIQIDNLLTPSYLQRLYNLTAGMNGFPWFFLSEDVSYSTNDVMFGDMPMMDMPDEQKTVGFTHVLLEKGDNIASPFLPTFEPLLDSIKDAMPGPIEFTRVRLALQLNNGKSHYNAPHTDSEEDHYAAIFYLHDSSGDTVFFDQYDDPNSGTVQERWYKATTNTEWTEHKRVTPEANKLFVFDGHQFHASSNPTQHKFRVILNLNFYSDHDLFGAANSQ